jgi:hypothetical protein
MPTGSLDVPKALAELKIKSKRDIDQETAWVWASRALAALQIYEESRQPGDGGCGDLAWLVDAANFRHEAIEHAAEGGNLAEIEAALGP